MTTAAPGFVPGTGEQSLDGLVAAQVPDHISLSLSHSDRQITPRERKGSSQLWGEQIFPGHPLSTGPVGDDAEGRQSCSLAGASVGLRQGVQTAGQEWRPLSAGCLLCFSPGSITHQLGFPIHQSAGTWGDMATTKTQPVGDVCEGCLPTAPGAG